MTHREIEPNLYSARTPASKRPAKDAILGAIGD